MQADSHVGLLHGSQGDGEPLQFSTTQLSNLSVHQVDQFQLICQLLLGTLPLELGLQHLVHRHTLLLDLPRDQIDILRLDDRFDVVLEHFGEEVLQFGTSEVFQNLHPLGRVVVSSQVGFKLRIHVYFSTSAFITQPPVSSRFAPHLPSQDLQRRTLSDTVRPYQSQNLSWSWRRQPMQLEGVCSVSVGHLRVEICGQVENLDGVERAPAGKKRRGLA
jgi:hypothetical protein